ncbi:hypothetical protein, partial [Neobacillus vireti]|uniref:hypothetical protein n=1 Tax=Neobacillus vireti TaxID=220686 RepID=UPI003000F37E
MQGVKRLMFLLFFLLLCFPSFSSAAQNVGYLSLSSTSGKAGSTITVYGSQFSSYESGYVYLDTNNNGVRDSGEAYSSTTSSYYGSLTAYLTVPSINAGTYPIRYSGASTVNQVSYTVQTASLTLYTTSGTPGSTFYVYGSNLPSYESGYVYLDANGNGVKDSGEWYTSTYSSYSGGFTAYMTVPTISAGTYNIRYSGTTSVSPVSFTVKRASLSVSSTSGKPGTLVYVYGSNLPTYEYGYVYLDTNGNGVRDSGEAYTSTSSSYGGSFTAYLTVPNVSTGTYNIRYSGTTSVSPISYTVQSSIKLTLNTTSGKAGSTLAISGSSFPLYEYGYVYLDANGNGVRDSGEAYGSTYSSYYGSFTAYLTVPSVSAGTYNIRYSGTSSVSPVSFTVLSSPKITLDSTSGRSGSIVTVSGSNLPSYESGYVYLDANGNGVRDSEETYKSTYGGYSGSFTASLTVPSINAGTYSIRYSGASSINPVNYTVTRASLTIDTTSGRAGSIVSVYGGSFPSYESGYVYLDTNGNGVRDSGEAYTMTYSSSYSGSFYAYLTVPNVSPGTYNIRYSGATSVSPVSYTVLNTAKLTTYTTSGNPGSTVTVYGSSFLGYESGYVYLDSNGNGIRDIGESYTSANSYSSGSFTVSLTVPSVTAGTYSIRYSGTSSASPVSYTILNAAKLTIGTVSGKPGNTVTVYGSNFPSYDYGYVYLDANGNGIKDSGEAYSSTYNGSSGSFTVSLTVPSISAGTYYIRYYGTTTVSPVSYTVLNAPKLTTNTTSGIAGSTVTVSGSYFSSYESGYVYFDANGNGVKDSGEAYTSTNGGSSGTFAASLTIPSISAGTYYIRYSGSSSVSPVSYKVLIAAKLTTYTTSGKPGSSVTVYGDSFPTYESGYVYLDTNGNGVRDSGEAYASTYTSYSGSFYAYLTVPTVSAGTYNIRYSGTSSVSPVSYT